MASNAKKQGGRTTAKGTQPAAKKPKGPAAATMPAGKGGRGGPPEVPTVNRQMRRSGLGIADQAEQEALQTSQRKRLRMLLIIGGGSLALATIVSIVLFRLSGTWIGILGAAAGLAAGFAGSTGRTFAADKGKEIGIGLGVLGVAVTGVGAANVVDVHWPFAALVGCGIGGFFAWVSAQQLQAPPDPPAAAVALLLRNRAQTIEAPGAGGCLWATPDGRVRVIVGATPADGVSGDDLLKDKNVLKSRQRAMVLVKRLSAGGVEQSITCVVDSSVPTVRDGDTTIVSAANLTKVLARPPS